MKKFFLSAIFFILCQQALAKNIAIIATGGTISGAGESSIEGKYSGSKIDITAIINKIPGIANLANIQAEQLIQINSQDMDDKTWLKIAARVNELLNQYSIDGVVITHGTDTMEETAYFLNLVVRSKKPVVVTGSMRPSTSLSADGALNLYNAVAVAANDQSYNKGVVVVMNDEIFSARDVAKTHTTNVASFVAHNGGALGFASYGKVKYYYEPLRAHTMATPFKVRKLESLPKAAILYSHSASDDDLVDQLIKNGTKAIITAGVGDGNVSKKVLQKLQEAQKQGILIVRSSRGGFGFVEPDAEISDFENGFVSADNLSPQKARILAMLALTQTDNLDKIRQMFGRY